MDGDLERDRGATLAVHQLSCFVRPGNVEGKTGVAVAQKVQGSGNEQGYWVVSFYATGESRRWSGITRWRRFRSWNAEREGQRGRGAEGQRGQRGQQGTISSVR
jgi:hypothetical protein